MNTVDRELYEIEHESMLMDTALTALMGQAKIVSGISNEKNAKILLPVLENNLGIQLPKERYVFSGILAGESMEVPSGEVLDTVKKVASGIYDGIKAVVNKLIELARRFVSWVKSFFSKEAAVQVKQEKAFKKEVDVLDKQLDTAAKLDLGKAGMALSRVDAKIEKFIKDTEETGKRLGEVVKAFDNLPKDITPEQAKKALESLEVVVDKDDIILDPKKLDETPVNQLVDESNVIPFESKKKPDPKKNEIKQPQSFVALQNLYFNPESSKPFDEINTANVRKAYGDVEVFLAVLIDDIEKIMQKDADVLDVKAAETSLGKISAEVDRFVDKFKTKDMPGVTGYMPKVKKEKIGSLDFSTLILEKFDRTAELKAFESKRPSYPIEGLTTADANDTIRDNKERVPETEKTISEATLKLEDVKSMLDEFPSSYSALSEEEKKEFSEEEFVFGRALFVTFVNLNKTRVESGIHELKYLQSVAKAMLRASEDIKRIIRKKYRSLKKKK